MFIDSKGYKRKPVAYLADFQMFLPNAEETVKTWRQICDKYGIIALFPSDEPVEDEYKPYIPKDDSLKERAIKIYVHNCNQMKRCDMVIAQLDNWRSFAPDSGTAWETGYCLALNKPCYGYVTDYNYLYNRSTFDKYVDEDGITRGLDNLAVEQRDFVMDNIFSLVKIAPSFIEACKLARKDFDKQLIEKGYEPFQVKE